MRALLDTCALLWFLRGDRELSSRAAELIENELSDAVVSVASIWEISIKAGLGKLPKPEGLETTLEEELLNSGFTILPIRYPHAARVSSLPAIHNDPFDRLLIAQCLEENLVALTDDPHWSDPGYGLKVIW